MLLMEKQKLELIRGDTTDYTLSFTDENGNPIDISGWKICFTVKANTSHPDEKAIIKKDLEIVSGENGKATIRIEPEDTEEVKPGIYTYDFQVVLPTKEVYTVLIGEFEIIGDVTRRH